MHSVVEGLQNISASVAIESAALAVSETFEQAVLADAALSRDQIEAMLRYSIESRHVERFGWADGPFNVEQIARHWTRDELASSELVLHSALRAAVARLHALAAEGAAAGRVARSWRDLSDVRGPLAVIDGYLYRRAGGVPLLPSGFNVASTLFSLGRHSGHWALDQRGARRLRALGANLIVISCSPARLLLEDGTVSPPELSQLREELESADASGLAVILHVCCAQPGAARLCPARYSPAVLSSGAMPEPRAGCACPSGGCPMLLTCCC